SVLVIGVFILTPSWQNFIKLLIILFLQLATSSIGSMAIARSAYLTGSPLRPGHFDHLAEDQGVVEDIGEPDEDVEEPEENVDEAAQNDNWAENRRPSVVRVRLDSVTASKHTASDSAPNTLMVIDGHSMAYRAFFALPAENFQTTTGQHTNAVYGFVNML